MNSSHNTVLFSCNNYFNICGFLWDAQVIFTTKTKTLFPFPFPLWGGNCFYFDKSGGNVCQWAAKSWSGNILCKFSSCLICWSNLMSNYCDLITLNQRDLANHFCHLDFFCWDYKVGLKNLYLKCLRIKVSLEINDLQITEKQNLFCFKNCKDWQTKMKEKLILWTE